MNFWKWIGLALLAAAAIVGYRHWFGPQLTNTADFPPLPEPVLAAAEQAAPVPAFVDITAASGIDFVRSDGAQGRRLLPETMGGGVAFVDYDNDGLADVFLVDGGDWPDTPNRQPARHRLYRNLGGGQFEDVTIQSNLRLDFYAMGVAVADIDADGWSDLLLTGIGGTRMLRNDQGRFVDVSESIGLSGESQDWSTAAVFFDADRDGDLDLYVANYVRWSPEIDLALGFQLAGFGRAYGPPMNFEGSHSKFYLQGPSGQFSEVGEASGIRVIHPTSGAAIGKALGVVATDINADGNVDLLVANDTVRNFLFLNRGDGVFDEVGAEWGLAFDRDGNATGAMGIDSGWIGSEQRHAFLLGNFANEMSSLYVSQPSLNLYSDDAIIEGLGPASRQVLTFGTLFFDYDMDGRQDLLQTNGHIEEAIEQVQASQKYRQPGQLFWNCGDACSRRFVELDNEALGDLAKPIVGRGSAYADIDLDGDLDLLIGGASGTPLLLRNELETNHRWIGVRLRARGLNRDGLGARIVLHANGRALQSEAQTTRGYLSAVEPTVRFGLGADLSPTRLEIHWPDGNAQTVPGTELSLGEINLISADGVIASLASDVGARP